LGFMKGDQMSSGKRSRVGRNVVKPIVVAVALALPGAASFAASMTDVVTTRSDQNIDEQYGRDSVYAFSRDAKPYKPEQTASHSTNFVGNVFDKTKGFVAGAWDKTTSMFRRDGSSDASPVYTARYEPQPYGRAGGYTGSDRVAVVATTPTTYAANSEVVRSGQEPVDTTNTTAYSHDSGAAASANDAPLSARANSTVDTRNMAGNRDTMARRENRRDLDQGQSEQSATSAPVAPVVVEDRTAAPAQNEAPAMQDLSNAPTAEPAPANEQQDHSSAATDMRDQGTMTPDAQADTASTSGDVVHSGQPAATENGRVEGQRFDQPDSAHGQLENETQTR
jgi:hypothetical protein